MTGQLLLADQPRGVPVERWSVTSGDARLATAAIGPPGRAAWVLAHGVGSSARFITAAFAGPVLAAGHRLVTYDLRGHGASTPARSVAEHHLDVHAGDLAAVVASLDGDIDVVGGVSLGAHAAVRAVGGGGGPVPDAAAAAVAVAGGAAPRVVLGCLPAWVGRSVAGTGAHAGMARRVRELGVVAHREAAISDPGLAPWLRDALTADLGRHDAASLTAALLALDGAEAPTLDEVARLVPPLAVLAWDDDPGHPLAVAERWVTAAGRGHLCRLAVRDLDVGVERLGRRAVAAVTAVAEAGTAR